MAVGRQYPFVLDPALPGGPVLSGGAAYVGASGPLPARVTPVDAYRQAVLALSPSDYWPMGEATGNLINAVGNGREFTSIVNATRHVATHTRGGQAYGVYNTGTGATITAPANAAYRFTSGQPKTLLYWTRVVTGTNWVLTNTANAYDPGWQLAVDTQNLARFRVSDSVSAYVDLSAYTPGVPTAATGVWVAIVYNGGAMNLTASWAAYFNGVALTLTKTGAGVPVGGAETTGLKVTVGGSSVAGYGGDLAFFPVALSAATILALATATPVGRARWTLPADAVNARTLKGLQIPGATARMASTTDSRLGVRTFYSLDGGANRTEFDPGNDIAAAVPAGSVVTLDADLIHCHIEDLPWVADSLGGGPVALYDEPDPAHPANATAIRSTDGAIEIDFDHGIEGTAQPTSDPHPAVQLGVASIVGGATLRITDVPSIVVQPRAAAVAARAGVPSAQGRASVATARSTAKVGA